LPDEPPDTGAIRWAPGAFDGVAGHHMGVSGNQTEIDRVVGLLRRAATDQNVSLDRLDAALADLDVMASVDSILARLADANLSVAEAQALGQRMATAGRSRNTVKLGVALLGGIPGTENRELFLTIGRHDEFTLYAAVAIGNTQQQPDRTLWELAKVVTGWGRIHVVERLGETLDPEIRRWILRTGFHNDVMDEYLVYIAATTGGLVEALRADDPDDELLDAACDILSGLISGGPAQEITDYGDAPYALDLLLAHLEGQATSIHHYLALHDIDVFLADDNRWLGDTAPTWPSGTREAMQTKVRSILARPEWPARARTELASADGPRFHEAERAARALGIDTFEANLGRVLTDPHGGGWYNVMGTVDDARLQRVLDLARASIPIETLSTGPGMDLGLGPEFKSHSDLEWIVQGLERFPGRGWDFIATALRSPVVRGRWTALRTLDRWPRSAWPSGAAAALVTASKVERSDEVRQGMIALAAGDRLQQPGFSVADDAVVDDGGR